MTAVFAVAVALGVSLVAMAWFIVWTTVTVRPCCDTCGAPTGQPTRIPRNQPKDLVPSTCIACYVARGFDASNDARMIRGLDGTRTITVNGVREFGESSTPQFGRRR